MLKYRCMLFKELAIKSIEQLKKQQLVTLEKARKQAIRIQARMQGRGKELPIKK